MAWGTRLLFQGLFERFLSRRLVKITRFPQVICPKCTYRQGREQVIRRILENRETIFCGECGGKIDLQGVGDVIVPFQAGRDRSVVKWAAGGGQVPDLDRDRPVRIDKERDEADRKQMDKERDTADVRTKFEAALVTVKSLARKKRPTCFISHAWGDQGHELWVEEPTCSGISRTLASNSFWTAGR